MKVLLCLTGTTFFPSAAIKIGSSPPKVIQKEVEAPPSITRKRTFSPGLNSGCSEVCSPLIKNAG